MLWGEKVVGRLNPQWGRTPQCLSFPCCLARRRGAGTPGGEWTTLELCSTKGGELLLLLDLPNLVVGQSLTRLTPGTQWGISTWRALPPHSWVAGPPTALALVHGAMRWPRRTRSDRWEAGTPGGRAAREAGAEKTREAGEGEDEGRSWGTCRSPQSAMDAVCAARPLWSGAAGSPAGQRPGPSAGERGRGVWPTSRARNPQMVDPLAGNSHERNSTSPRAQ